MSHAFVRFRSQSNNEEEPQKSNPDAILRSLLFVSLFNLLLVRLLLYITVGVLLLDTAVSNCWILGSDDIFFNF